MISITTMGFGIYNNLIRDGEQQDGKLSSSFNNLDDIFNDEQSRYTLVNQFTNKSNNPSSVFP